MSRKRAPAESVQQEKCSRCLQPVGLNGGFSERERDRLVPPMASMACKHFDSVDCFYSELCDSLLLQHGQEHFFAKAAADKYQQLYGRRPVYVAKRAPPRPIVLSLRQPVHLDRFRMPAEAAQVVPMQ
jgi:hypothetical protein